MTKDEKLPRNLEGLTKEWLTKAIRTHCPEITVTDVSIDNIIWGTATKVLMDLQYEGDFETFDLPHKLCVKGEFDDKMRDMLKGVEITGTQIEADFYQDMGQQLGVPMPRHWFAGSEPGMGILILDNLNELGATFGAPTEPWSPDRVAKMLDILAVLHGSTWEKTLPNYSWLKVGSQAVRQYTRFLQSNEHWKTHFVTPGVFQMPHLLADCESNLRALEAMWKYDDTEQHCLIHGDAHIGNTCIDANGQPFFIDWAGPCLSHWALDVSYFVAGTLVIEDRRAHEKDLLHYYLEKLQLNGGPTLDSEKAWHDYRLHHLNGLNWATLPPTMQPLEYVHVMGERHTAAIIEHDALKLAGV